MQKIVPSLWFDKNAEAAIAFYSSVFKNSKLVTTSRYGDAGPGPKGTVMAATFQLNGQDFSPSMAGRSSSSRQRFR